VILVSMLHSVVTLDQAAAMGISERKAYRYAENGTWRKLQSGIFLTDPSLVDDELWKAELAASLLLGGELARVSHRAAAILHGLDGVTERAIDVTIPTNGTPKPTKVHRTRTVDLKPVVIDGLRTTSVARTLLDLASLCSADVVEQALHSALRGPDPWRPDVWDEELLSELRKLAMALPNQHGGYVLRRVLALRSDSDRPTGSQPETVFLQALRGAGVPVVCQPTLRIVDRRGANLDTLYPDFAVITPDFLLEVDGVEAHSSESSLSRDLKRQNKLQLLFPIRRYSAVQILNDAAGAALEVKQLLARLQNSGVPRFPNITVSYSENEILVVDSSRDARQEALNRSKSRRAA
jgi:very-short-patch-repair endonuclease